MAGHSKWANIKHRKGREDAKKGKVFGKLSKELTVAAKLGGGDADGNPRLRLALEKARVANMPKDNVKRAIAKGTGELGGVSYEQNYYEGYGPGGVAVYVETLTDNRTRTVGEVRHAFSKCNGAMGEPGCVAWLFSAKGLFYVPKAAASEDRIMEVALEAGAEDVKEDGDLWEIITQQSDFGAVANALEVAKLPVEASELTMVPQTSVKISGKDAENMLKLMEWLEDNDDVQNVYANFDIDDAEMERLAQAV